MYFREYNVQDGGKLFVRVLTHQTGQNFTKLRVLFKLKHLLCHNQIYLNGEPTVIIHSSAALHWNFGL